MAKHLVGILEEVWGETGYNSSKSVNFSSILWLEASLTQSSKPFAVSLLLPPGECNVLTKDGGWDGMETCT